MTGNAKIRKTFNYLIRLLIIGATYVVLYYQVFYRRNQDEVWQTFRDFFSAGNFRSGLALLLAMMLVNWVLEAVKWKILIRPAEKVSLWKSFQAVLSGISVSIFLPNRTGEFLGRVFVLEKANRVEGSIITIIGSISQLLITVSAGMFAAIAFYYQYLHGSSVLHEYLGAGLVLLVPIVVFLLLLFFFNLSALTPALRSVFRGRWERLAGYAAVFSGYGSWELAKVLIMSFLRYMVFSTQFFILLRMFDVPIHYPEAMVLIATIYLLMTVLPTFTMAELGIRGSVSVYVFSYYFVLMGLSGNAFRPEVFAASSALWLINIVGPALLGTIFVFRLKFFRK